MISIQNIHERPQSPKYRVEFLIDSETDIADLPTSEAEGTEIEMICAPGSIAYTADLTSTYMLGNDNIWHKW